MATRLTDLKWLTHVTPNCRLQRRGLEYLRDHRRGSVAVTLQTRRLDHRPTQGAGALPFEPLPYALLAEDMCAPQLDRGAVFLLADGAAISALHDIVRARCLPVLCLHAQQCLRGCIQLAQAVDDGFALECEVQPRCDGGE
eukprot:CAMPEP_0181372866 /NCGR_PEP_ID=MMETSP1106-20121128/15019_2 /TAXON_ID=81844 /ORGANISM="Mantoniella antarctica, Strain SL-175" /LENGTH=140 /DNA_ID=CAMNT_0023490417 /DNA_START=70 /DNA_END=491 /DNA_ORIENTATION=-